MSDSPKSFIELAVEGVVSPAEIDAFVDRWHEMDAGRELHDYLGLTRPEHALWLVEPDMLTAIIEARTNEVPLQVLVSDTIERRRITGTPDEAPRVERLDRWLTDQKTWG